jgi:predicted nucleotidyltransferase
MTGSWRRYIERVATLAQASLTHEERALLERFVADLGLQLGDQLGGVWLFGSRARGESPGEHSDIDLLVLVEDASWEGKLRIRRALRDAAAALGIEPVAWEFSVHVNTPEWLEGRRRIRSFFIAEVDRDKVVLHGSL